MSPQHRARPSPAPSWSAGRRRRSASARNAGCKR